MGSGCLLAVPDTPEEFRAFWSMDEARLWPSWLKLSRMGSGGDMRLVIFIFFAMSFVAGPAVVAGECVWLCAERDVCAAIVFGKRANGEEKEVEGRDWKEGLAIEVKVGAAIACWFWRFLSKVGEGCVGADGLSAMVG